MSSIENQIHFEQLGLGSVLKRFQLQVPANQREYSWTDREVTTLLTDFASAISEGETGYFLGTIVTIPKKNGVLEVVDGQQRLATTAMLFRCIYEFLQPRQEDFAASIKSDFLVRYDRNKKEYNLRLTLNQSDNDFFRAQIQGDEKIPEPCRSSHEKIEAAFKQCREQVNKIISPLAENGKDDVLNRWVTFIEEKALVVLVRVTNDANAYKMFETLNDRGLKTSQSDLVKNHLFGTAGERIGEVQVKWTMIRGALESLENEDLTIDFLRHALITTYGLIRETYVYQTVQSIAKSPQAAITFAGNMEMLANYYVAIHNPEHEKWNNYNDSVRHAIELLNVFSIKPMRPLMLAVAAKFDDKKTAEAFKFLITLSVRLLICGESRTVPVEQTFAQVAKDIYAGRITDFKAALKSVTPTDEKFRSEFERATVSKMQYARYYLRSLELAAKKEKHPWLIPNSDRQVINLEHILPRKPEKNWPNFNEDEVDLYVNRLGNMALLTASSNSNLKSIGFEEKKNVYMQSPYILTNKIAKIQIWDKSAIMLRQKELADLALYAWKI